MFTRNWDESEVESNEDKGEFHSCRFLGLSSDAVKIRTSVKFDFSIYHFFQSHIIN